MKRILSTLFVLLALLAAKAQDMSNSIEYSQLYIVGSATDAGWSDTNAPEMSPIDYGVFSWTGTLKGGEEFKFLNTRSWYKNVLSAAPDVVVDLDKNYSLDFYAAWDLNGKDWKFKMPTTAVYTVIVDLRNMKMKVTEATQAPSCPEALYVTGSALNGEVVELSQMYGVEHKKTISCRPGNLIVIDTPAITDQTNYYGPMFDAVDISFGKGYTTALCPVDKEAWGWSVTTGGDYSIYVDRNQFTYQAKKYAPLKVLYIVGGCCELNWNYWDESNKRFVPNPDNPDEMIWEGELRFGSAEEPDRFKILTAESWTNDTYHPYIADALAEGVTDARISGGDDLKWTIKKEGHYRLTLNTRTETLTSEYFGDSENVVSSQGSAGIESPEQASARVYVDGRSIVVDTENEVKVLVADLAGRTLAHTMAHRSGVVADDLSAGLYLVVVNGLTHKVLVR